MFKFLRKGFLTIFFFLLLTVLTYQIIKPVKAALSGDVNGDGKVNLVDIGIIIDNYIKNPIINPAADLNSDGQVDIIDIGIVIDNYGKTQNTNPTPTPTMPLTGSGIGPINLSYKQGGIWLTPAEIQAIPTNNASWNSLVSWANKPMNIVQDITWTAGGAGSGDCQTTRAMFARAIVGLRTNNQTMINQVKAELDNVDEAVNKAVDVDKNQDEKWAQRNIALLAVSANLVDYRPQALKDALRKAIYIAKFNGNSITIQQVGLRGLSNKPAWGRWSLMSTAYLLEDWTMVNAAVKAHSKSMGEKNWGGSVNDHQLELSGLGNDDNWQTLQPGGKTNPLAIMPAGIYYQDHGVGGLWLADQYRAGNGPVWPPSYTNYIYEGMGSYIAVAWSAEHLGYSNLFKLGNYALLRSMLFQFASFEGKPSWPAESNDSWQVAAVMTWAKKEFGSNLPSELKPEPGATVPWPLPVSAGGDPGRGMGFMYATHYAHLAP